MAGTGSVTVTKVAAVGNIQSTHQYDVTVLFKIAFDYGGFNDIGASYVIKCDGQTFTGSAKFHINSGEGNWVWGNIASHTFRVTMPTSGKTKTINISASISTGGSPATISANGSKTLSAVTWQWPVNYNANGGSGAPSAQTKTYGKALTLSSTSPTRTGYTFLGWASKEDATAAEYSAGGSYSTDKSVTLYAVWAINTFLVAYNANGGSGAPSAQTKTYGTDLTLSTVIPTRTNYNFKGWATSDTAVTATYEAGGTYSIDEEITLYAVWELAYWVPKITNITISRCDAAGNYIAYGKYAKVTFDWECCQLLGANTVESITAKYAVHSSTSYISDTIAASGISGTATKVIGSNDISTEEQYDVIITVIDSQNGTSNYVIQLSMTEFTIDCLDGGKGVAIGKPAEIESLFDVAWDALLRKKLTAYGDALLKSALSVDGKSLLSGGAEIGDVLKIAEQIEAEDKIVLSAPNIKMEPTESLLYDIPVIENADCDTLIDSGKWFMGDGCTNRPNSKNGWLECKKYADDYCSQVYTTVSGEIHKRYLRAGTWGRWSSGLRNMTRLWTGTLSAGGSVTVTGLDLYDLFLARTSDGVTMMWGMRYYDDSGNRGIQVRFTGGYNDKTASYTFEANTEANGSTFKLIQASRHKLSSTVTGEVLTLKALWGVM